MQIQSIGVGCIDSIYRAIFVNLSTRDRIVNYESADSEARPILSLFSVIFTSFSLTDRDRPLVEIIYDL
ncbi:MAG: hypothetical protein N4J56_004205 [Chroococcidiopsis sp. SAG 2025]|nr:hypothetical protein [Chroococcidiopsis sp. SAG 2025]